MEKSNNKHRQMDHNKGEKKRSWEPFFVEQVPNITVPAGKDATLSCQVDNLHGYKVRNASFL